MIEVQNLVKSFDGKTVLKGITLTFEPGKANMIIGASGSGKTTLTKCMVGLHYPTSGNILYDQKDFFGLDEKAKREIRKNIGFMFQGSALFDSLTVEDNIKFTLSMFSEMTEEEMLERANFCLKRVNLENVNKLFPAELSGGMKKRVGIARAIAMEPKYLFCDEPN